MDKYKILEYIKDNKDNFKNNNYVESLNNIVSYASKNNIILDDELISFLIQNSSTLRIILEKAADDSNDYAIDSLLCRFLAIYFSSTCEEDKDDDTLSDDTMRTYLIEIGKYPTLDEDVVRKLLLIIRENKDEKKVREAVDTLVKHNLRLVVSVAKRYKRSNNDLQDLIADGNEGLLTAVQKYDLDKGADTKFSTYAYLWIKQKIIRGLALNSNMGLHAYEDYVKFIVAFKKFIVDYGCEPTDKEMAQILNIKVEKVKEIKTSLPQISSIEATLEDESKKYNEIEFADDTIDEQIDLLCQKDDVKELLVNSGLTERELMVIILRYGLNDGRVWTLEEIGNRFNVTKERIRVNEASALRKLRNSGTAIKFKEEYSNSKVKRL